MKIQVTVFPHTLRETRRPRKRALTALRGLGELPTSEVSWIWSPACDHRVSVPRSFTHLLFERTREFRLTKDGIGESDENAIGSPDASLFTFNYFAFGSRLASSNAERNPCRPQIKSKMNLIAS